MRQESHKLLKTHVEKMSAFLLSTMFMIIKVLSRNEDFSRKNPRSGIRSPSHRIWQSAIANRTIPSISVPDGGEKNYEAW
jgi:hypothetical protein